MNQFVDQKADDDASRYCEAYPPETFSDRSLSAKGIRIDIVHPVARSLCALSDETPFIANSEKAISRRGDLSTEAI
jgi:hypothetical protein